MNGTETQPAPPVASARGPQAADTSWLSVVKGAFGTPSGIVALLLIGVQAIWRGGAVAGGYFSQDDYVMLARASEKPMGLAHLTAPHAGEFSPVGNFIVWATTQMSGIDWIGVTTVVVVLQTLVAVLTWIVLTQVLEDRWVKVPLMAVACFTPLTLSSTLGWAVASTHLPSMLILLIGVVALLAHLRGEWYRGATVAAVALPLVLFCSDRALLLPIVAFIAVAAMLESDDLTVRSRLVVTAKRYAQVWIFLGVALVVRVLVAVGLDYSGFAWPTAYSDVRAVTELYVKQGFTGVVGGPWVGEMSATSLIPTETWPMTVATLLCLLFLVPVLRHVGHPAVAVATAGLAAYCLLGAGLIMVTQQGLGALGTIPRFLGDSSVVVVLCLALALRKTLVPKELTTVVTKAPALVAVVLAVVFATSAGITTRAMLPTLQNEDDRAYVDNVRTGLELQPQIVVLDGPVPDGIMSPWFGDAARVSTVVALLPQRPAFDVPSEHLGMVDGAGVVRGVQLSQPVKAEPVPADGCGFAITSQRTTVPLAAPAPDGTDVVEFVYITGADGYALLEAGESSVRVPIREGMRKTQVPVDSPFTEVHLTLEDVGQMVCITQLGAGVAEPAPLTLDP